MFFKTAPLDEAACAVYTSTMKKLKNIFAVTAATLILCLIPASAGASTIDDLQLADQNFSTSAGDFYDEISTASSSNDVNSFVRAVDSFKSDADSARDEYAKISSESNSTGWKAIASKLSDAVSKISIAAEAMSASVQSQDSDDYYAAANDYQAGMGQYQSAIDEANDYLVNNPLESGDTQYLLWFSLLGVSILAMLSAVAIFVFDRKRVGDTTTFGNKKQATFASLRRNILIGAGIFVVGAAIPAFQYWYGMHNPNADGTFTYYIFYWPLLIGGVLYVAGLVQYAVAVFGSKKGSIQAQPDTDKTVQTNPFDDSKKS